VTPSAPAHEPVAPAGTATRTSGPAWTTGLSPWENQALTRARSRTKERTLGPSSLALVVYGLPGAAAAAAILAYR
jgi:hypothetical protein